MDSPYEFDGPYRRNPVSSVVVISVYSMSSVPRKTSAGRRCYLPLLFLIPILRCLPAGSLGFQQRVAALCQARQTVARLAFHEFHFTGT